MIEKFEGESVFVERMKNFNEDTIECTSHSLFRLSEKQRETFTCDVLKGFLLDNEPLRVGIKYNRNYAVYYNFKGKQLLKIILSVKPDKIRIVTFKILDKSQLPR